jgi:3-phenylpropionate/trans-cinnamate dioxygenase ferredoxin reductase subunit
VVSEPQNVSPAVRGGLPTEHIPALTPDDVVYTCGAPPMTMAVAKMARAAGARCYSDPFESSNKPGDQVPLMDRLSGWLNNREQRPTPAAAARPAPRQTRAARPMRPARQAG